MPGSHAKQSPSRQGNNHDRSKPVGGSERTQQERLTRRRTRYFGEPDAGEKPLGFLRLLVILMASHIGVRSRANREEDFRRADGLHVFIAAIIYFLLVIGLLILLVNTVTG